MTVIDLWSFPKQGVEAGPVVTLDQPSSHILHLDPGLISGYSEKIPF